VSVVIPCFNEEHFIGKVLHNLKEQYPKERYEIVIVDGISTDRTRAVIAEFVAEHPGISVRVVENPARNIPAALNLGIAAARGQVIVRMDAHSIPTSNYVRRCVEVLGDSEISVVGMPWRIRPGVDTTTAQAIALAVAHPFGIGDAKYRMSDSLQAQLVDTVPFGAFRKTLWEDLGGFNADLLTNEDYDFNYRVRLRGGKVLLDTAGYCNYFARPTFRDLAAQYYRYGSWKAQMVKLHPRSIKLRHLVAPLFVASVLSLGVLSLLTPLAAWLLFAILAAYTLLSLLCAFSLARSGGMKLIPAISVAFLILHVTWGGGFLLGLLRAPRR
jgi:glycosyltransferase involved in cell wall biosynthesis